MPGVAGPDFLTAAIGTSAAGAILSVLAVPRSGVTALDRPVGGAPRVRIAAPPVDGAANATLERFLAELVGLPRGRVRVVAGASGRRKRVLFEGLTAAKLAERLAARLLAD